MALRARRRIGIGGGLRMNISHRSVGLSGGVRGARYSVSSSGRRTRSVGIPGSGISHVSSSGGGTQRSSGSRPQPRETAAAPAKPGMLAPKYEKAFYKGVQALLAGQHEAALGAFREASERDTSDKSASDDLLAGLTTLQAGDHEGAIPFLEKVVGSDVPLPDELVLKYAPSLVMSITVTENVSVESEPSSLFAALALVESYQRVGRAEEAIGLLQGLVEVGPEPALVLSLCELYADEGDWDEIVDLAAGTPNEDDVTLQIRLFQAQAMIEQGMREPALEVYRDALRSKKRSPELLKEARYSRGRLLIEMGKRAQGRKDLAGVYADDPGYRDVADLVRDDS
jgi:tetratricopeptide (TPR) repeat protein